MNNIKKNNWKRFRANHAAIWQTTINYKERKMDSGRRGAPLPKQSIKKEN